MPATIAVLGKTILCIAHDHVIVRLAVANCAMCIRSKRLVASFKSESCH